MMVLLSPAKCLVVWRKVILPMVWGKSSTWDDMGLEMGHEKLVGF
jgi:hypothetical protein